MKALTLWRPWPWAIFHAPRNRKRIENRPWCPPASLMGHRFAIHAGQTFHEPSVAEILEVVGLPPPIPGSAYDLGIIGTAVLKDVASDEEEVERFAGYDQLDWWSGPNAWIITDVRPLVTPIACNGKQGLWTVPDDIERVIVQQLAA